MTYLNFKFNFLSKCIKCKNYEYLYIHLYNIPTDNLTNNGYNNRILPEYISLLYLIIQICGNVNRLFHIICKL